MGVVAAEFELVSFELIDDVDAAAPTGACEPVDFEAVDDVEVDVAADELLVLELLVPEDVVDSALTLLADCVESSIFCQISRITKYPWMNSYICLLAVVYKSLRKNPNSSPSLGLWRLDLEAATRTSSHLHRSSYFRRKRYRSTRRWCPGDRRVPHIGSSCREFLLELLGLPSIGYNTRGTLKGELTIRTNIRAIGTLPVPRRTGVTLHVFASYRVCSFDRIEETEPVRQTRPAFRTTSVACFRASHSQNGHLAIWVITRFIPRLLRGDAGNE